MTLCNPNTAKVDGKFSWEIDSPPLHGTLPMNQASNKG